MSLAGSDNPRLSAEAASGIRRVRVWISVAEQWDWSPQVAALFGFEARTAPADFEEWQRNVFVDDVPKIRAALEAAKESGASTSNSGSGSRMARCAGLPARARWPALDRCTCAARHLL